MWTTALIWTKRILGILAALVVVYVIICVGVWAYGLTKDEVVTTPSAVSTPAIVAPGVTTPSLPPATVVEDPVITAIKKQFEEQKLENERAKNALAEQNAALINQLREEAKTQADEANKARQLMVETESKAKTQSEALEKEKVELAKKPKMELTGVPVEYRLDPNDLKARFQGFDEKQVPGFRVPMMSNSSGKPSPFSTDYDPPVETAPTADWQPVTYRLLNGTPVQAWAIKAQSVRRK